MKFRKIDRPKENSFKLLFPNSFSKKILVLFSYNLLNIHSSGSRTRKGYCFTDKRRYKTKEKSAIYSFGRGTKGRMGGITNSENKQLGKTVFGKFKKYGRRTPTSQRKCK